MPVYDVVKPGFMNGRLYDPNGKRKVLHTDKPLKPVPEWLTKRRDETAAEKKKRQAAEKKARDEAEKAQAEQKVEKDNVTFMGDEPDTGATQPGGNVETL